MREDTPAPHRPQLLQPGGDSNQAQPLLAGPPTPAAPPFKAQLSLAFQAAVTGLDSLAIAEQPHIRARRSQAVLPKCGLEALRGGCRQALWPSRSTAEGGQKTDPLVSAGLVCWEWGQGQAGEGGRISSSQTGVPESAALLTPVSALRPSQVHSLPAVAPLPS